MIKDCKFYDILIDSIKYLYKNNFLNYYWLRVIKNNVFMIKY